MKIHQTIFILLVAFTGATPVSAQEIDVTRVGVILPLTGEYSQFGQNAIKAMQLSDQQSAGRKLKLFFEDNRTCAAPDAVTAFKKLTELDKPSVLITFCTAASKGILPLAKARKIPLIQITEPGEQNDSYMIKMMPRSMVWNEVLADAYAKKYSKMALVANSMEVNTGEDGNIPRFTKRFERDGGKVVFSEEFPDSFLDFRGLIIRLKGSGAQAVSPFIWNPRQLANFMSQADQLNLWEKMELAGNFTFEVMYRDLAPLYPKLKTMDGLLSVNFADTTSDVFKKDFSQRYGDAPGQFADYSYDAIAMVKRCAADMDCLGTAFEGASGHVEFDNTRRRIGATALKVLQNGSFVDTSKAD